MCTSLHATLRVRINHSFQIDKQRDGKKRYGRKITWLLHVTPLTLKTGQRERVVVDWLDEENYLVGKRD